MTGIYKITNQINNKVYIGQSVNIKKRFNQHKCAARDGENSYFYKALRKYGVKPTISLISNEILIPTPMNNGKKFDFSKKFLYN